jgi:hypothetical protein
MRILLRKFVCAVFGFETFFLLPMLPLAIFILQRTGYGNPRLNATRFLTGAVALSLLGVIFAFAWWTNKTSRPSGRGWGIAASLINILLIIPILTRIHVRAGALLWLIPIAGIIGIVLFAERPEHTGPVSRRRKIRPIPGDGTNVIVNKLPWLIGSLGGIAGYIWCIQWCHANGVPTSRGLSYYAQITLVLLLVTLIHESGHALGAWGVGMKIRAFVVGPFQFRMREAKWGFQFNLAQTFSANGATGAVHTNPHQPVWCDLLMIVAGPLANLGTGIIAFCAVFLIEPDSPLQAGGMLFLFGIYSFIACATNLIPFRSGEQYSDGAQIYQYLAGGPFAALHGAFSLVASSLVTPLRPRDYNVELMERATAGGAAQGKQLMLLCMLRHHHFFDCGQLTDAALALTDAEAIYQQYASEIPAELHTDFIFGNAYVKHDAMGARAWWQRMEEKKPTRFNGDYWLAHSALHWIEGDLYTANDSWHKGAAIAKQLPNAGAYEFDRYRYVLLRQALDESSSRIRNRVESAQSGAGDLSFQPA